ncbi:MAG: hypothetical protein H0U52_18630 [Chloroflexi bacterium]|nr:hypothetical protein [Chloroflexota bacterium]
MRHSNQAGRGSRPPSWAVGLFVLLAVGCGQTAAPSASPTAIPTPVVTPDPHLKEPVTADQVFRVLSSAKLGMRANNATLGGAVSDVVKVINADIGGWPLRITEYRSTAALRKAVGWKSPTPARNETPYAIAGLNVLIAFGPVSRVAPPNAPEAARQEVATAIVAALDPLLWPLAQHSVVVIAARSAEPAVTGAASAKPSPAPSRAPSAAPSKAP